MKKVGQPKSQLKSILREMYYVELELSSLWGDLANTMPLGRERKRIWTRSIQALHRAEVYKFRLSKIDGIEDRLRCFVLPELFEGDKNDKSTTINNNDKER